MENVTEFDTLEGIENVTEFYAWEEIANTTESYTSVDLGAVGTEAGAGAGADVATLGIVRFHLVAYSISTVLCIVLNALNLAVVPRASNCFSENTRLCLFALSVVDLLTGVICSSAGIAFVLVRVPPALSLTVVYLCTVFVWQSMMILTLASLDRYVAVTRPLRYMQLFTHRKMIGALVVTFLATLANVGGGFLQSYVSGDCNPLINGYCTTFKPSFASYNVLPFVAVIVSLFVNVRLFLIGLHHDRQIAMQAEAVRVNGIVPGPPRMVGIRGLKTILVLTASFYIVWLPSSITAFVPYIFNVRAPFIWTLVIRYMITCNSWFNVVVYLLMHKTYRAILRSVLIRLFPFCRSSRVNLLCDNTRQNVGLHLLDL